MDPVQPCHTSDRNPIRSGIGRQSASRSPTVPKNGEGATADGRERNSPPVALDSVSSRLRRSDARLATRFGCSTVTRRPSSLVLQYDDRKRKLSHHSTPYRPRGERDPSLRLRSFTRLSTRNQGSSGRPGGGTPSPTRPVFRVADGSRGRSRTGRVSSSTTPTHESLAEEFRPLLTVHAVPTGSGRRRTTGSHPPRGGSSGDVASTVSTSHPSALARRLSAGRRRRAFR